MDMEVRRLSFYSHVSGTCSYWLFQDPHAHSSFRSYNASTPDMVSLAGLPNCSLLMIFQVHPWYVQLCGPTQVFSPISCR